MESTALMRVSKTGCSTQGMCSTKTSEVKIMQHETQSSKKNNKVNASMCQKVKKMKG